VDKYYLSHWETLSTEPPRPASEVGASAREPDVFTQMPVTRTTKVERLRYMTDPLPHDVTVAGPITLTLYAAIDQDDTNWIIVLKDVGPDVSVRTAREGERDVPSTLPERELTRGWLKASYRALDEKRSKPWEPFHKLTQDAIAPVKPGEVVEYQIQVLATANQFKAGTGSASTSHPWTFRPHRSDVRRRVHSVPCLQQQDRHPQDLSGRGAAVAFAAANHPGTCRPASGLISAQRSTCCNDNDPI